MHLSNLIACASLTSLVSGAVVPRQSCSRLSIDAVMKNWASVWKSDFSVMDQTVTSDFQLVIDRLPQPGPKFLAGDFKAPWTSKKVSVSGPSQLEDFIKMSTGGFSQYGFINDFDFASTDGTMLATRWRSDVVVGQGSPSPIRKVGDKISWSGTDVVRFDTCTGRIQEVWTSQDILSYLELMGIDVDLESSSRI